MICEQKKCVFAEWNVFIKVNISGEPNNVGGNEACLQFYHDKGNTWNDLPCSDKLNGYICMKGG